MRLHAAISTVLVAAIFAIYFQVRDHAFVNFDDTVYLVNIQSGLDSESVHRAFTSTIVSNWVPLTWVSLLADYELYGREPAGYLLTNVALHAFNAVLLYILFFQLTGRIWRSAFVAAIFAVHPLHVESVAWLSERKDSLSGLFWLLALLAYARYATGGRTRASYAAVFVCLALGLMAKPMVVTLPFVLLLLDYWPLGRLQRESGGALPDPGRLRAAVVEKLPLFALIAAGSVTAVLTQWYTGSAPDTELIPATLRIANAFESYVAYSWASIWPTGLHAFYPHPQELESPGWVAACAALLLGVTLVLLRGAARRPWAAVGWLWFLGTLVPVIGLVQVGMQARADRYMYLPQIGLSVVFVWGVAEFAERRRALRLGISTAAGVAIVALAVTAWHQTSYWQDTTHLWTRSVAIDGESFRARRRLGGALRREGRFAEAEVQYSEALRLQPLDARARVGMAETLTALGRFDRAIPHYERALELRPDRSRDRINFAWALFNSGQVERARKQFEKIESGVISGEVSLSRPFQFSLHSGLAATLEKQRDFTGAIRQLEKALAVRPNAVQVNLRLGSLALRTGRDDLALVHLERAVNDGGASPEVNAAIAKLRRRQLRAQP